MTKKALVYFAQVRPAGPIKIGVSVDPPARLAALQVANPMALVLLGMLRGHALCAWC